jgi:hypothetical protein
MDKSSSLGMSPGPPKKYKCQSLGMPEASLSWWEHGRCHRMAYLGAVGRWR